MSVVDWVSVVRDIGFPIVVALILLIRLDHSLSKLRESIDALKEAIIRQEADCGEKRG